MGESIKSIYKPQNPHKYQGNPNNIICRSTWERRFCHWCDVNDDIVKWASEEFSIPYLSPIDNKVHRYFPDALIEIKGKNGKPNRKCVVEIKPKKQTKPPERKERITKSFIYEAKTFAINQAKWKAADEFCKDNGVEFMIITEDHLGIKDYGKPKRSKRRTRRVSSK